MSGKMTGATPPCYLQDAIDATASHGPIVLVSSLVAQVMFPLPAPHLIVKRRQKAETAEGLGIILAIRSSLSSLPYHRMTAAVRALDDERWHDRLSTLRAIYEGSVFTHTKQLLPVTMETPSKPIVRSPARPEAAWPCGLSLAASTPVGTSQSQLCCASLPRRIILSLLCDVC
jgi:hypothetical protein